MESWERTKKQEKTKKSCEASIPITSSPKVSSRARSKRVQEMHLHFHSFLVRTKS